MAGRQHRRTKRNIAAVPSNNKRLFSRSVRSSRVNHSSSNAANCEDKASNAAACKGGP